MDEQHITEKSLLEIWSKTIPKIPKNRFNTWASLSGVSFGIMPFIFGPIAGFVGLLQPYTDLLSQIYASLLGFIIAGYAIFTSVGNPKFLVELWKHTEKRSGLPLLKLHLLVFVRLFIVVFAALIFSMAHSTLSRLWPTVMGEIQISTKIRTFGQAFSMGVLGWTLTATAIQLKTLIFNLYDLTLMQVQFLQVDSDSENK